jgi:hypothetical protein
MNSPGKPSIDVEYNVAQYGLDHLHERDKDRARAHASGFEPVTSDMSNETVIFAVFDAE